MKRDLTIVKEFKDSISQYKSDVLPLVQDYMSKERKKFVVYLEMLDDLFFFVSYLMDEKFIDFTNKFVPIGMLFGRSLHTLNSISLCLKGGRLADSLVLIRNNFELFVNLKLILEKQVEERIQLYSNFIFVERWKRLEVYRKLLEKNKITQAEYDAFSTCASHENIKNKYEEVKNDYHHRNPYSWHWKIFKDCTPNRNRSLKFVCEKLEIEEEYEKIYSLLSLSVHHNPLIANALNNTIAPTFTDLFINYTYLAYEYQTKIIKEISPYCIKEDHIEKIVTYLEYKLDTLLFMKVN